MMMAGAGRGRSWLASGYGGLVGRGGGGGGVGGAGGLGGLAGGWGLNGGRGDVASLVGGDDLLGLAGGGGLLLGSVDRLLVFGFAACEEGECKYCNCCGFKDRSGDHCEGLFLVYVLVTDGAFGAALRLDAGLGLG